MFYMYMKWRWEHEQDLGKRVVGLQNLNRAALKMLAATTSAIILAAIGIGWLLLKGQL